MKVLVITTAFTCLAAFFVAIRLWTRIILVKKPGLDDVLIVLALVGLITLLDSVKSQLWMYEGDTDIVSTSFAPFYYMHSSSLVSQSSKYSSCSDLTRIERHYGLGVPDSKLAESVVHDQMRVSRPPLPLYTPN